MFVIRGHGNSGARFSAPLCTDLAFDASEREYIHGHCAPFDHPFIAGKVAQAPTAVKENNLPGFGSHDTRNRGRPLMRRKLRRYGHFRLLRERGVQPLSTTRGVVGEFRCATREFAGGRRREWRARGADTSTSLELVGAAEPENQRYAQACRIANRARRRAGRSNRLPGDALSQPGPGTGVEELDRARAIATESQTDHLGAGVRVTDRDQVSIQVLATLATCGMIKPSSESRTGAGRDSARTRRVVL